MEVAIVWLNLIGHFSPTVPPFADWGPSCRLASFYGKELFALLSTHKLEDHPFSAVCGCLFNTFAATLHSGGRSSILILRTLHAMSGTRLSWVKLQHCKNQEFNIKTLTCFNQRTLFQTHISIKEKKHSLKHLIIGTLISDLNHAAEST
jgi:hypothetical protein